MASIKSTEIDEYPHNLNQTVINFISKHTVFWVKKQYVLYYEAINIFSLNIYR
jgi:hypothetical protein